MKLKPHPCRYENMRLLRLSGSSPGDLYAVFQGNGQMISVKVPPLYGDALSSAGGGEDGPNYEITVHLGEDGKAAEVDIFW